MTAADAAQTRRPRVLILYKSLPQYRVEFYCALRERLAREGIDLELAVGQPTARDASKNDTAEIPWATRLRNRVLRIGGRELIWQPCLRSALRADLVIVEQASKLAVNYVLLALQRLGLVSVGFWGHGANLQVHTVNRAAEAVKRVVSRYPHWWFAYTDGSKRRVTALGYPPARVTVVQNAIDTRALAELRASVEERELAEFRAEHGLGDGPVAAFVGGLYAEKRLEFLLAAADLVHARSPGFRLVVVGDGPQREELVAAARARPYVRYLGPLFGRDKVLALSAASVLLMPGLVGLVVLDSFALETPLVTTAVDFHSPEIEYLEDGVNGVVVGPADDSVAYAAAVCRVLDDGELRARLEAGCRAAADRYTNDAMVERFSLGIRQALRLEDAA